MAPPTGQIRPARYLTAFVLIVAALYSLVFFTGDRDPTPKLGIDLQGGTRVTLTARTEDGEPPTTENLQLARTIIETRVNGIGVSGSEVVIDGSNLVITVPGDDSAQARSVGQTARLYFRSVQQQVPAGAPVEPGTVEPGQPAPSAPDSIPPSPNAVDPGATDPSSSPAPQGSGFPAQSPTPTPPPTPAEDAPTDGAPTDDGSQTTAEQTAAEIAAARQTRQSEDPAVQAQALAELDCAARDPLVGNDDPELPLVTCNTEDTAKYVLGPRFLDGTAIDDATSGPAAGGVGFSVNLTFTGEGSETWGQYTAANVGQQAAFVLDTSVVSAPTINSAILGGTTEITGDFSQPEAQSLADTLRFGSLPLSFTTSETQTVSASLGLASLEAGLLAGGVGLILVLVYCLLYYRLLGVLTALSLVLSFGIVYAVIVLLGRYIGFTLDLAGIAGLIVAIGITADSFVVFFERLKDEVREGRSFRSAVPRGWVRARRTILSADAVSFLAAAVLYALAVGQVKGFAFTLGVSTVLDLVVVFLVTHPLVVLATRSKTLSRPGLTGLGAAQRARSSNAAAVAAAATAQRKEA